MSNDRRVFVLSGNGEVGPYTNEDLRREVAAGTIQRSDQVRTAAGKVLGTVADFIGGHAHVSGRQTLASPSPTALRPRRKAESGQLEVPRADASSGNKMLPAILAGVVVLVVALGMWLSSGGTPAAAPRQSTATTQQPIPRLHISVLNDAADAQLGTQGLLRFMADTAPTQDLVITLQASGTAGPADIQAIPEKVVLPAGKTSVDLPIIAKAFSSQQVPPRVVTVRLMADSRYQLGGTIHATILLKSAALNTAETVTPVHVAPAPQIPTAPPPVVLSSLTRDDFLPRNPYNGAGGGQGWNGPWVGSGMQFLLGGLATPKSVLAPAVMPAPGNAADSTRLKNGTILLVDFGEEAQQTGDHFNNLFHPKAGEPGSFIESASTSDGLKSGVTIVISDSFLWTFNQGVDAAGLFPATAQRDAFRLDRASDALGAVTISHLDPTLVYDIDIFASALWPENIAIYTIGTTSITLDPANNTNRVASFTRIVPDARGAILLEVRIAPEALAALISVLKITARSLATVAPKPVVVAPTPIVVPGSRGNTAPTISALPSSLVLQMGRASELLPYTVTDKQTVSSGLKMTVSSSNAALIATLALGGTMENRTLRITPAVGQVGTTTITLTVSDGTLQASQILDVTVTDQGHALIPPGDQIRRLAQRITGGNVWLSYYAQAPIGSDAPRQLTYSPWKSLGPFQAENHDIAFSTAYIDEQGIDPQPPASGPVWVDHPEWTVGNSFMFADVNTSSATYLFRTITVAEAMTQPFAVGSDDGLRVWLNGQLVWSNGMSRGLDTQPDVFLVNLQPGVNRLLMKITNNGGGSGFIFRDELPGRALGVSFCDGEKEQVFTGYSRLRTGISVEALPAPKDHYAVLPAANFRQGTHVVVRLSLEGSHTDVALWVDPPSGPAPTPIAYARFEALAFDRIKLHVDPTMTWKVGDLRLGTTWDEVVAP